MDIGGPAGTRDGLKILQSRMNKKQSPARRKMHFFAETRGDDPIEKLIQFFAIPIALHIGLAKSQGSLGHDAGVELRIMDLGVPRPAAVDLDAGRIKKLGYNVLRTVSQIQ